MRTPRSPGADKQSAHAFEVEGSSPCRQEASPDLDWSMQDFVDISPLHSFTEFQATSQRLKTARIFSDQQSQRQQSEGPDEQSSRGPSEVPVTEQRAPDTRGQRFVCSSCKRLYKTSYQKHIRLRHNSDGRSQCQLCTKSFSRKDNLKRHMQKHLESPKRPAAIDHAREPGSGLENNLVGIEEAAPAGVTHPPQYPLTTFPTNIEDQSILNADKRDPTYLDTSLHVDQHHADSFAEATVHSLPEYHYTTVYPSQNQYELDIAYAYWPTQAPGHRSR